MNQVPIQEQPKGFSSSFAGGGGSNPSYEILRNLDKIFIRQEIDLLEAFTGCQIEKKFVFQDERGQVVFTAKENSDCCERNCCKAIRSFNMTVKDLDGNPVIHLDRPLRCDCCLCPSCLQLCEIKDNLSNPIGLIEQDWAFCNNKISLKDEQGEVILRILGEACYIRCCNDRTFKLISPAGDEVGMITKKWAGCTKEAFTQADNFFIEFPQGSEPKMKAMLLATTILINYMYFELEG